MLPCVEIGHDSGGAPLLHHHGGYGPPMGMKLNRNLRVLLVNALAKFHGISCIAHTVMIGFLRDFLVFVRVLSGFDTVFRCHEMGKKQT